MNRYGFHKAASRQREVQVRAVETYGSLCRIIMPLYSVQAQTDCSGGELEELRICQGTHSLSSYLPTVLPYLHSVVRLRKREKGKEKREDAERWAGRGGCPDLPPSISSVLAKTCN